MPKKFLFIFLLLASFMLIGAGCQKQTATNTTATISNVNTQASNSNQSVNTSTTNVNKTASIKEFEMTAKQWEFNPSTITVSQGDKVKLNINSIDVDHGFAISEFGVNETLSSGQTTTVEFTADKVGTYTFFCSVQCGAGHSNMQGQLEVEECEEQAEVCEVDFL